MKKYILIIRLGESKPSVQRIREAAPKIKEAVEKHSNKDCQLAFTTPDGSIFGYLLQTSKEPSYIRAALTGNLRDDHTPSILRSEDSVLCIEIGDTFSGEGFSRAWTWLQHR